MTEARPDGPSGPRIASVPHQRHHPSHDRLLPSLPPSADGAADVIIVPTMRPTESLRDAFDLGRRLGSPVLALCSGDSDPRAAVALAATIGVPAAAVDFAGAELPLRPRTTALTAAMPYGDRYHEISLKRNAGLLVSHMAGPLERVLFLDDDIEVPEAGHARAAAAQLDDCHAVGLRIVGFQDNSVVCHASRVAGNVQSTFVGGGALAVRIDRARTFFPGVYNEDWFFVLDAVKRRRIGRIGVASQRGYDPFADPGRARAQEFGDCLAEGIYARLDDERDGGAPLVDEAAIGLGYWRDFLEVRAGFIDQVREQSAGRPAIVASLDAAAEALRQIAPEDCVGFLTAWRDDIEAWRRMRERLPTGLRLRKALLELKLSIVHHTADFPI